MRTMVNGYRRSGKQARLRVFLVIGKRDRDGGRRQPDAVGRRPMPFDSPRGLILRMAGDAAKGTICSACRRRAGGRIIVVTMKTACSGGVHWPHRWRV